MAHIIKASFYSNLLPITDRVKIKHTYMSMYGHSHHSRNIQKTQHSNLHQVQKPTGSGKISLASYGRYFENAGFLSKSWKQLLVIKKTQTHENVMKKSDLTYDVPH
jgi:hypothetical protein